MDKHYGILGAGPSGLSMGMFLKDKYSILERSDRVGGHASSYEKEGYTFDYGPHIMFSKNKAVLDFMINSLGKNVNRCRRNNKIQFKDKLTRYPFENDLGALSREDNFECTWGFLNNPYRDKYKNPKNLEQWLLSVFGTGICEAYLFPYNRKVWNLPVDKLSMLWAERIPRPSTETIVRSALGYPTEGYLHQLYYHYPKKGGYQALSEAFESKVKGDVIRGYDIKSVRRLADKRWEVTDGKNPRQFDSLISTLPVHELVKMAGFPIPERVRNAIKGLIVNPMFVISLGIKGTDREQMTAVYFPDEEFLVNRISYPATFSPYNAPKGYYSIQAEITCKVSDPEWKMSDKAILEHVISGLETRKLLKSKDVVLTDVKRSRYSYVVYDSNYQKNVAIIRDWFPTQGIHLVGRFSYFEYINVDAAIERAIEIAGKLNGSPIVV